MIDGQYGNRHSPNCRSANESWTIPGKVMFPLVSSWMKQRNKLSRLAITSGDVGAFMQVASVATERKIAGNGSTTVLFGDDVVDGKSKKRIVVLAQVTILTTIASSFAHQPLKLVIHDRRSSWPKEHALGISGSK